MEERAHRIEVNRRRWDELVQVHLGSPFYDLEGFRRGGLSLRRVEREEVGDVTGADMLHLQCHFGLDTLSWARLGARVTGVDFSPEAIRLARRLADELELQARFICADVTELDGVLQDDFDIVFASYGTLNWIDDLDKWADAVAGALRPEGRFHLVEFHPFLRMFDPQSSDLRVVDSYFRGPEPVIMQEPYTYADPDANVTNAVNYQWPFPLSDVVTALLQAGLQITGLREFASIPERWFPHLVEDGEGWFRQPSGQPDVPLLFSLAAQRPHHTPEPR